MILPVPILVTLFLALAVVVGGWIWTRPHRARWKGPPPDFNTAGFDILHRYALYLCAKFRAMAQDSSAPPEVRREAARGHADLKSLLGAHPLTDDLRRWMLHLHNNPILFPLPF